MFLHQFFNAQNLILFSSGYTFAFFTKVFMGREYNDIAGLLNWALLLFSGLSLFFLWQQLQHSTDIKTLLLICFGFTYRWFYSPSRRWT